MEPQAAPQPPQWAGSQSVSTHAPEHSVVPVGQSSTHDPPEQIWSLGQATPQPLQLSGSTSVSTQTDPQRVVPPTQSSWHVLAEQTWPLGQAL
jgi:hypothetical protein